MAQLHFLERFKPTPPPSDISRVYIVKQIIPTIYFQLYSRSDVLPRPAVLTSQCTIKCFKNMYKMIWGGGTNIDRPWECFGSVLVNDFWTIEMFVDIIMPVKYLETWVRGLHATEAANLEQVRSINSDMMAFFGNLLGIRYLYNEAVLWVKNF